MDNELPDKISAIVAAMCDYDCEKKKALSQSIASSYVEKIKSIQIAEGTLTDIVKSQYIEIVANLKTDLRIFLGSNLLVFLALIIVSFAKPKANTHLFVPGLLLVASTVISSSIYIFGQDWFFTILYNDYIGLGYLAYISVIFVFLLDIIINRARLTSKIINGIASAIGSTFSVAACN
ncbi:hypothetical protein [Thaumasiovibrio subtropicus]|uniref:hypothetical protein n=1 Tax=Thaumasiovibrio subtropicus TaxID=1891207 RepID=UPI001C847BC3|nr:hypothetical protein [Thaumasiovibrio subtropicus]